VKPTEITGIAYNHFNLEQRPRSEPKLLVPLAP